MSFLVFKRMREIMIWFLMVIELRYLIMCFIVCFNLFVFSRWEVCVKFVIKLSVFIVGKGVWVF